jgi:hypothetical protein
MSKIPRLGRRVREIGVAGVLRRVTYRLRRAQTARARDAWALRYASESPDAAQLAAALGAPDVASLDAALVAFADRPAPFWIDTGDASLRRSFLDRHRDAVAAIVAQADATLAGDVSWVVPGGVHDWHAALPGSARWPLLPAGDVPIGAAHPPGDVRLAWEYGRCTHVVRLAQAAWLTGEDRYAHAVVAEMDAFLRANPPGRGIAWAHAQEAAIRAVAWLWAFRLTRRSGVFDPAALRRWLWLVLSHGDYVATHLADHPSTHNHLVSEAAGLAALGLVLASLAPARTWRDAGLRVLWREAAKQVDDEGVHGEHSSHYHAFVLDSFLATLLLADRSGARVPDAARSRIAGMADAMALLLRNDGTLPAIGDTDAGRAWRFGGDPLDRRDLLATAAIAFGRRDWGAIAGDAAGAFWLGGGRPVPGAGDPPPPGLAKRFSAAGLGVARTGFGARSECVVFRCGPTRFRPDVLRSHMHADALSVLWRIGDDDVLTDAGTFLYSETQGWRAALRGTRAHSCVVVDGRDQADVTSQRFGIAGERCARWIAFEGDAQRLLAAAEHPDGAPLRVRRSLAWRAGGLLALCDDVLGAGDHAIESRFVLPATTGEARDGAAVLALTSGRRVRLDAFGPALRIAVERPVAGGAPGPGWIAPRYGRVVPGTSLRIDAGTLRLPLRIVTVLQTRGDGTDPAPARVRFDADGSAWVTAGACGVRFAADGRARFEDKT